MTLDELRDLFQNADQIMAAHGWTEIKPADLTPQQAAQLLIDMASALEGLPQIPAEDVGI